MSNKKLLGHEFPRVTWRNGSLRKWASAWNWSLRKCRFVGVLHFRSENFPRRPSKVRIDLKVTYLRRDPFPKCPISEVSHFRSNRFSQSSIFNWPFWSNPFFEVTRFSITVKNFLRPFLSLTPRLAAWPLRTHTALSNFLEDI